MSSKVSKIHILSRCGYSHKSAHADNAPVFYCRNVHSCTFFSANFDNYVKGDIFRQQLTDILGRGIFVSDGDEWRFHRKTASNIFTTKFYRSLVRGAFRASADDLCTVFDSCIAREQPIDLQGHFLKLTLDAFGKLTFGIDFGALAQPGVKNEFGDAFDFLTTAADSRISNPFWPITDRLIPGRWKKHWGCIHTLDRYAAQAVSARRSESSADENGRQRDLLDYFISYRNDDGSMLTDREVIIAVGGFFLGWLNLFQLAFLPCFSGSREAASRYIREFFSSRTRYHGAGFDVAVLFSHGQPACDAQSCARN